MLFRGRRLRPFVGCAGAAIWLALYQLSPFLEGSAARTALGALVVATYTFFIALEFSRERRKSMRSRTAAIVVPFLHAAIFLLPLGMRGLARETILYAVGTASSRRHAALTDYLTGLLNRRAFLENALQLCVQQGKQANL